MAHVTCENLSFAYSGTNRLVLEGVNMDVEEGEFVCILGQSGCGKSTYLRLLAGLETPTSGELKLDGQSITEAGLDRGVVFQDYGLFPWMSAGSNIMLALEQKDPKGNKAEFRKKIYRLLSEVGLDQSVYDLFPKELSGGMKQRCAIARVLGIDPPVFLMDEPFGALDAITRAHLQDMLMAIWQREKSKTAFFVTHDVDEALLLATRIYVFGQSPAGVIFECSVPRKQEVTRESIFTDPALFELRTELIRQMNLDVSGHMQDNDSANAR